MGFFDNIAKLAEKAASVVIKTSEKINEQYQKDGFDSILTKTADSLTNASEKTQNYLNNIGDKNKQILDSIPDKDLEGALAKATAVVINTTQTIVKDAAKVTMDTVDRVSKNIDKIVEQDSKGNTSTTTSKTTVKENSTVPKTKDLFLNEGQIAELDCMPIKLYVKHLGAESNIDGDKNKFRLENFTFITNEQKWYDFNHTLGGTGSLSFINHYIRVKNELLDNKNTEVSKEIRNSSFDILNKIFELKEYQNDLTTWIKEQNIQPQNIQSNSETVSEEKTKRVRKPAAKSIKSSLPEESKITPTKTVKKLIVEKPVKKIVNKNILENEEKVVTSVKKTRKPKV